MPSETSAEERRSRNVETLRTYFRLLADRDIDRWITLWAEDCSQHMPFAGGSLPAEVRGRAEVDALYRGMAADYQDLSFADLRLDPLEDADLVLARWRPEGTLTSGKPYSNENVALFGFDRDGAIVTFVEYFDPTRVPTDMGAAGA